MNDWWLSKRKGAKALVKPVVDRDIGVISFEVMEGEGPAPSASKNRCLFSEAPIEFEYIKRNGKAGRLGVAIMATITHGSQGRRHFAPTPEQVALAASATPSDPPRLELPPKALGFTVQQYGVREWQQLFTSRQMLALETFASLVSLVPLWAADDGADEEYAHTITTFLGLLFLIDDGHRIDHPTTGPCTTKDIVDALFEVTAALTELAHDPGRRLGGLGLRAKAWPRYGSEGEIFEASQTQAGPKGPNTGD